MSRGRGACLRAQRLPCLLLAATTLLVGCASPSTEGQSGAETPRVVRQIVLPLRATAAPRSAARVLEASGVNGTLAADGTWTLRAEVTHPRLRCGTYSAGMEFGIGDADCSRVDWVAPARFGSPRRQCNGATLIHSSNGSLPLSAAEVDRLNCARVSVQCTGVCG